MKNLLIPLLIIVNINCLEIPNKAPTPPIVRHLTDLRLDIPDYTERSAEDRSPSMDPERQTKCSCSSNCSTDTKILIASISSLVTAITTITVILVHYYG